MVLFAQEVHDCATTLCCPFDFPVERLKRENERMHRVPTVNAKSTNLLIYRDLVWTRPCVFSITLVPRRSTNPDDAWSHRPVLADKIKAPLGDNGAKLGIFHFDSVENSND